MPFSRKRKASAVVEDQQASKHARTTNTLKAQEVQKTQKSINSFGTISKPDARAHDGKKRKVVHQRQTTPPPASVAKVTTKPEMKRKRSAHNESDDDEIAVAPRATNLDAPSQPNMVSTPRSKRVKNGHPPTPTETPSKNAAALFDKLQIDLNPRAVPVKLPKKKLDYDTPPDTPAEEIELDLALPDEIEELQEIYSALLAALSFYYSHNGTAVAVDLQTLLPMITKHWKKRAVTELDLQRVLALVPELDREFVLEDAGRAGIRLYRTQPRAQVLRRAASYIDERKMNNRFDDAIQEAWRQWQTETPAENRTVASFMEQIQLLDIPKNEAAEKAAPLFARGQQRLADIRAGQSAKTEAKTVKAIPAVQAGPQTTQSRSIALFDRILKKSQLASALPAGPTKAEIERKYALQRIEEVARVLSLMCGLKERCSSSMAAVTQQLQQSLRNPISQAEVWKCLGLMSTEITPGFVRVVQSGEVQGVVVTKSASVDLAELRERVHKACA